MQGSKRLVKEIGKGGFFGEVALVTKAATRVADCVAMCRSVVVRITGRDISPQADCLYFNFVRLQGSALLNDVIVIKNLTSKDLTKSLQYAQSPPLHEVELAMPGICVLSSTAICFSKSIFRFSTSLTTKNNLQRHIFSVLFTGASF